MSFKSGVFPDQMKIAKIIPIYKSGDSHLYSNYRPISLLYQFSKILEKLFLNRLDSFIEKCMILSDDQYGFRSGRSTSMAVIKLVDYIASALDKKYFTLGVFVDLKKAFDTIDHKLLMNKLEQYGLRGRAYSWLESYFDNRYQYVHFNDHQSEMRKLTCGVPQGSVIGPKLFILYVNDICKVSDLLKCVLFADDDTTLYVSGDNLHHLM